MTSIERAILGLLAALGLAGFVALGTGMGHALAGEGTTSTPRAMAVSRQAGALEEAAEVARVTSAAAGNVVEFGTTQGKAFAATLGNRGLDQAGLVIASNRGPVNFAIDKGKPVASAAGGGLATGLAPLVRDNRNVTWVAAAVSEGDQLAAKLGTKAPGYNMRYVSMDPARYATAYNDVANQVLWYVLHGFKGALDAPRFDATWERTWGAFRELNQRFADVIAKEAPEGAKVLVQDYHLPLVGSMLKNRRPDLLTAHFSHTPFAGPDDLLRLPTETATELLEGMCGYGACGFHTKRWASRFEWSVQELLGRPAVDTFVAPLGIEPSNVKEIAFSPEADRWVSEIRKRTGDRLIIGRTDRIEPSKNILTSFEAYERLLVVHPELRGKVSFVASIFPSREGVGDYQEYGKLLEATAERINRTFGSADWEPIVLYNQGNVPARGMAVLRMSDVVLINPVRDGLNLVAKEGALVNEHNGSLVLSHEAGFYDELKAAGASGAVLGINPYDVNDTGSSIYAALMRSPTERTVHANRVRQAVESRGPQHWLEDQLRAAK